MSLSNLPSDPSSPTPSTPASLANLRDENQNLRVLFEFTLVALILLSVSVSLFMFKQMRLVRAQLHEQRPAVSKLISDYQKNSEPLVRNFTSAIQRFAATNSDFQPLLEKYRPVLKDYLTAATPGPAAPPQSP